jgi:signal peptide peptidase SppA
MEFKSESIIASAIRTFCRSFAAIIGIMLGIVLVFFTLMMFSTPDIFPPKSSLVIAPDAMGSRDLLPQTTPVVLRLDITGVIGQGDLSAAKIQNALLDSRDGLLAHNRVKAVLLYINTPGGAADDANVIYRTLLDYKEKYQVPIYAYVEGMCASGGMYIACAADKIFASPTSVIGSVGVILGPTFNFSGLMDRYGVQALTLTQGKDKDMLNPFRPWVPGEDVSIRNYMADIYQQFVSIVTQARPRLDKEKLINEYGAQIYVAKTAQTLGYIDVADTDYSTCVSELAKAAKFSENQAYQVMTIQPAHPFLADLAGGHLSLLTGKLTHTFQVGSINSELSGRILYLYQPGLEIQ